MPVCPYARRRTIIVNCKDQQQPTLGKPQKFQTAYYVLLMDEIPNHHLGWFKTLYINNGIIIILGG